MRCQTGLRFLLATGIAVAVASGPMASAQTPSTNANVTAEALFEEGRALVAAGKYADACPKFADSQRLGPSVATLLNLANCWEKAGRTATAWATYREAASAANAAGRKDYMATAQRRADGLAPKLARLTITVAEPVAGLLVKRDGLVVDSAEWGLAIPVDTGSHSVEASAAGRASWSLTVDVAQGATQTSVAVPLLAEAPGESSNAGVPTTPASPASTAPSTDRSVENAPSPGGKQRLIGAIVGGAGVVGLGVGALFVLSAKSKYDESLHSCEPSSPDLCDPTGVARRNDARSAGNVATGFVGVGAAALVAGAIVWFSAPRSGSGASAARFEVSPTLGGLVARGAWSWR